MSPLARDLKRLARAGVRRAAAAPVLRRGALSLVAAMNRRTFRILRAAPGVADVFVRGSFVRGPYVPLASDVDLVLLLRRDAAASYAGTMAVHEALRRARRANLSLRDWWQHMIGEAELPVVEAFWPVLGAEEWRRDDGARAVACAPAPLAGELMYGLWAQLCAWSGSAVHAYLRPADRVHDFDAGLKKTLQIGSLFSRVRTLAGALAPTALAGLKREDAASCAASFSAPRTRAARRGALVRVYRALDEAAAALDPGGGPAATGGPPATVARVIRWTDAAAVVLHDGIDDRAVLETLDRLDPGLAGGRVTFLLPARAVPLFPFPADDLTASGEPFPAPSGQAMQRYLFEALFLPSQARVAIGVPGAGARLSRTALALVRAALLFDERVFAASAADVRRLALGRRDLLASVPRLEAFLSQPRPLAPEPGYGLCLALADRLQGALLAHAAAPRAPAAAEAAVR